MAASNTKWKPKVGDYLYDKREPHIIYRVVRRDNNPLEFSHGPLLNLENLSFPERSEFWVSDESGKFYSFSLPHPRPTWVQLDNLNS